MKTFTFILLAALLPAASATAAIKTQGPMARNMDDVQSLGVIYINHNRATESTADRPAVKEIDFSAPIAVSDRAEPGDRQ